MGTHPIFESDFDCLTDMSNDRKVDLGFIYKMLDTRDPSKRRVKPADPDLLVIRKVEHEDSDDDYTPEEDDRESSELPRGKEKVSKLRAPTRMTKTTKKATKRKADAASSSPTRKT